MYLHNNSHNYTQYEPTYNIITNTHHVTLQLLDPFTCLITNLPIKLPHNIITTHELLYSQKHKGYISKLKMLNSLKRCFQQIGLNLLELPNLAFKMFKSLQFLSNLNMVNLGFGKKYDVLGKIRKNWGKGFGDNKSCKFNKIQYGIHRKQMMYVGRWILTAHQSKIVHYFIQRGKRMIIGDGWNMGKTVTSLACMHYAKLKKILVIVPKQLFAHWYWHISQLCTSLSKNAKNQSDSSIQIQLLQFYQKLPVQSLNLNPQHSLKQETKTPKHEAQKRQCPSLKQQSHPQTKTLYSLVSYQRLSQILTNQQQFLTNKQYTAIIFDQLQIPNYSQQPQQLTTPIYSSRSLPKKHLAQLSKIQSIIICKNTRIQQTRELLPILNTKIDQKQLYARYGNNQDILNYPYQYTNALYRTFYSHNLDICDTIPGNLIKDILIADNLDILTNKNKNNKYNNNNKYNKYNNQNNQIIQQKQQNNIQPIPIPNNTNKYHQIFSYIKLRIQNNNNNRYYIIYNQYQTYVTIKQYLQHLSIKFYNLTQMNQYIIQNLMTNIVYMGTINQTIKYLTNNSNNNSNNNKYKQDIAIICDQLSLTTNTAQYYEMKLYTLYRYINIQYINLCTIQPYQKTYTITTHNKNNNNNKPIYIPYINRNKYINKLLMQGQYISSDSSMLEKQDKRNPQRYIESEDSEQMKMDNRMIDQSQQKILIKNNRNYGNVGCLQFNITGQPYRNSINSNMNNNITNIDDTNSYAKNNISDNNLYTKNNTTNKNNKQKVQIYIDSDDDDAQQIFFQPRPKLQQPICQIQSQSNKMDIENDNHQFQILNNQINDNIKQAIQQQSIKQIKNNKQIPTKINNKQPIDKITTKKKSNSKNKSNSKQKYAHQPIQQQKSKTKSKSKKVRQTKQKQQSKQKLQVHKYKQIQKQIIQKHKNYNKKISKNNNKYNSVSTVPTRRSTRNSKPINYNVMQNIYFQQHMIEQPQTKPTINKNPKLKQINQLLPPKHSQPKHKTQPINLQPKKQQKPNIIIPQQLFPQTKTHQFIQINSDQSSLLHLKHAGYFNNKKQAKIKSKHVLQVKLIPNFSQLYKNNLETIC